MQAVLNFTCLSGSTGPGGLAAADVLVRGFDRQALHAAELGFDHPVSGEEMLFEAPLPADMGALLEALRAG